MTFKHPNNPDVWWHYLLFLQSNLSAFSISTVVKAYEKCLLTLNSVRDGSLKSHGDLLHAEEHLLCKSEIYTLGFKPSLEFLLLMVDQNEQQDVHCRPFCQAGTVSEAHGTPGESCSTVSGHDRVQFVLPVRLAAGRSKSNSISLLSVKWLTVLDLPANSEGPKRVQFSKFVAM